ncbi:MAG: hypothetical protein J7J98_00510 [candidate division Zixibacteria bacterium]|nr:hypothetical protein [candidate division Zixibacteria bacterium]
MLLKAPPPTSSEATLSAEETAAQIHKALESSDFETAYHWLQKLIQFIPDSAQAHTTAGLVALQLDRQENATQHFTRALKLSPDDYVTNYNMALTEIRHERYDPALLRLRHLRRLDASNVDILNDIGVVWLQKNRPLRALASFSRAMKLDPDHSMARNNAMELCLTNGLIDHADKLLGQQAESAYLSPNALAEIHRWVEIIDDPSCSQNNSVPVETDEED